MCEIKTVSIVAVLLLAAAGFYTYKVNSETKVGQNSDIKSDSPCENEYKKYFMNRGECYYLADEEIVGCNCTWLFWRKTMWKVHVVDLGKLFKIWRVVKKLIQNLTRRKKILFKNTLFTKTFSFKIMLFRKFFFFGIVLFKYAGETQILRILRGKMRQNVIF